MKICTWNINGILPLCALSVKDLLEPSVASQELVENAAFDERPVTIPRLLTNVLECDVLCCQETKLPRRKFGPELAVFDHHDAYYSFCRSAPSQQSLRIGYSGTATFVDSRLPVHAAQDGLLGRAGAGSPSAAPIPVPNGIVYPDLASLNLATAPTALDDEGRAVLLDLGAFILINVYCPNRGDTDTRAQVKADYHSLLLHVLTILLTTHDRDVILVGDLNVSHRMIDHADPATVLADTYGTARMPDPAAAYAAANPTRAWFDAVLALGMVDAYRAMHPESPGFTCWNTQISARRADFGTRIDYILVSPRLVPRIRACDRMPHVLGSDHCPVYADLDVPDFAERLQGPVVDAASVQRPSLCARYLPELSARQQSIKEMVAAVSKKREADAAGIENGSALGGASVPGNTTASSADLASHPDPARPSPPPSRLTKRIKTDSGRSTASSGKQSTLSTFFTRPAATPTPTPSPASAGVPARPTPSNSGADPGDPHAAAATRNGSASASWATLFRPREPPKCAHGEPGVPFSVNKKGPNQGRKFWVCARPVGPKSAGLSEFRCNFFEWDNARKSK
ncbi:exodeoxyribonuclease III (xth) [Allomyces macrogynus ATCC 38327]|uniref:DNA-(apurinic or apyrimidinic site) endonuclease n=1 Tax=Allomyces macrogynus (strain ATCC 38327) TaxID=578462 RepID=A0A0L0S216_ALLM3|nr:exodeoxyribonuclease III (xth) [Allomyces macrogynus ATCC 38327]|eukprot:KNE56441.1 exodeoxyribonuclease III (xth) [Allomyces macrogynus ATCC 38327]